MQKVGQVTDLAYLMKVSATPFRCMLSCVAVENGEESLAANAIEIKDERVGILHGPPSSLVFGNADLVSRILRR